ncbi:hypothetical protein FKP32DRAFT_1663640 [Trametes sanguinea]|nr:hypothetical protein FKP32DRAFT_1663640 [Trametes sanguinea]
MTEEAAALAREAKSLQQTLKESLKSKDPWDRETDFTRKQLRRNCLRLLLLHPYAPESKDAETMLWIQTSYAFISLYKQRIAALDRAIHGSSRQQQQQQPQHGQGQAQGQGQQPPRQQGGHGVVEYRKLLQRFRQFLADEEKFWIQLILRIRRIFQMDDVQPILAQLEILPAVDETPAEDGPPKRNHFQFPPDADLAAAAPSLTPTSREQRESRLAILSKALVCLGDIERYKEQYNEAGGRPRAGHEDGPPAVMPSNQKGRARKGGGAPVNGALPVLARMRDYHKAQQCYQQARLLLPQDGNPAHQLAIIASYQKDTFASLVHYYRALCVRSPYDTAADNLGTVLAKALEAWKSRGAKKEKEREKEQARGEGPSLAPRLRVEAFKEKLIVLHALWRVSPEDARSIAPHLARKVAEDFKALVSERVLPSDIISNAIVLAQGALWKHRMFRNSPSNGHRKSGPAGASVAIESSIAGHLLAMQRVLLEVGIVQIAEAPSEDTAEHDLAQRITAEFRRTLPALRIASKWLRANLRYLAQAWQQLVTSEDGETTPSRQHGRERRRGGDRRASGGSPAMVVPGLRLFWRTYAHFSTVLWRAFPQERLPKTTTTLEEDIEMAGFLPLKKFVPNDVVSVVGASKDAAKDGNNSATHNGGFKVVQPEQVHPNEEQLMRISDLLADALALARDDICPLSVSSGRFSVQEAPRPETRPAQQRHQPRREPEPPRELEPAQRRVSERLSPETFTRPTYEVSHPGPREEDSMTDVTRTEDDPVREAFLTALGAPSDTGDDDDDEQIVWPRCPHRASAAPPAPPRLPQDPAIVTAIPANASITVPSPPRPVDSSPVMPTSGPRSPLSLSPIAAPKRSAEATPSSGKTQGGATAKDILANLQRGLPKTGLTRSLHARQASAPAFHMLFGPNPLGGGPSIWSSDESDGLGFQGAAGTSSGPPYQSYHLNNSPPHTYVRHASSSFYPVQPPLSTGQAPSLTPTRPHPNLSTSGLAHQRVQSLSINNNSQFLSSSPGPQFFPSSQSQPPFPEGFGSFPALSEQSTVPYSTGVPGAYADPVFSRTMDAGFARQDAPGYPDRSIPYHWGSTANGNQHGLPLSAMSQLWNNTG